MIFKCTVQHCYYHVVVKDQATYDRVAADHGCPNPCGTTTYGPEYTMSLLSEIWEQLDKSVAYIKENPDGSEIAWHKAYAAGISFTLAKFMVPHFHTQDDISREALKRYKMHQEGTPYDTPGLVSRKYEIPSDWKDKYPTPERAERSARPTRPTQAVKQLNEKELQGIRNGKGFFDVADVARMYGVPEARVEEIWASI